MHTNFKKISRFTILLNYWDGIRFFSWEIDEESMIKKVIKKLH